MKLHRTNKSDAVRAPVDTDSRVRCRKRLALRSVRRSLGIEALENRRLLAGDTYPHVVAFERFSPVDPTTAFTDVTFSLRFNESVVGVDSSDLRSSADSTVTFQQLQVSGTGADYQVTVLGITGAGVLKLQLVDDGSIRDLTQHGLVSLDSFAGFQELSQQRTVDYPAQSVWADFNGDSLPEGVVTGQQQTQVLLGKPDGTLDPQIKVSNALNLSSQVHVAVADFNRDALQDYVVVGQGQTSGVASVYLGQANGGFQPVINNTARAYPGSVVIGDVNQDGKPDAVMASGSLNTVDVMIGQGDGRFAAPYSVYTASQPNAMALSDLNGDGKLDLVLADYDRVTFLAGNGTGAFTQQANSLPSIYPTSVATGDINSDGLTDVVAVDMQATQIALLINQGNNSFSRAMLSAAAESIQLIDANGDGALDLVTCNGNAGVTFYRGFGNGQFASGQQLMGGDSNLGLQATDINRDGKLDLRFLNYASGTVKTLANLERGDFESQPYAIVPQPVIRLLTSNRVVLESGVNHTGRLLVSAVLSSSPVGDTFFSYELVSGTATAGADFIAASGTIHFAANEIVQIISIDIVNDEVPEQNETFSLRLFEVRGAKLEDANPLQITIMDDDAPGTLTLVVHGFQCDRDIPGWAEAIGHAITNQLNIYSRHNETRYVGWDSGFRSEDNEVPTSAIADKVVEFFNTAANSDIRDLLLVGHSRGGIFVTKVAEKISSRLASRLGYVEMILLDPTGAVPTGDHFPTTIASIVDRTIDYHDNHTLVNDLLVATDWLSDIRTLVNFFGKNFPNDWLAGYFRWLSQSYSLTLDSDLRPTEISYTLGESIDVHDRMLAWNALLRFSETGVFPDGLGQRIKDLGHDLSYVGDVTDLASQVIAWLPAWLPGKYRAPDAINRVKHSVLMHTHIHDWWRENQLPDDVGQFVSAKTGWTNLADHRITESPTLDNIESWIVYVGTQSSCFSTPFDFPLLSVIFDPLKLIRDGFSLLVKANANLISVAEAGFDLALQAGKNNFESLQLVAQGLYAEATSNVMRVTETVLKTAQQRSLGTKDALLMTASALESLGPTALPIAASLRLIATYAPANITIAIENDRLILDTTLSSDLGQVTLHGYLTGDGVFDLKGRLSTPKLGRFVYPYVYFEWINQGVFAYGLLNLPAGLGSVMLSGLVKTTGTVEMQGTSSLNLKGFVFQQMKFSLKNSGMTLSGRTALPLLGSANFLGGLYRNGDFYLLASVRNQTLADMAFPVLTLTLSNSGLQIAGTAALPIFLGRITLKGYLSASGAYSLQGSLGLTKAGINLQSVTLANSGIVVKAWAPQMGQILLKLQPSGSSWLLEAGINKALGPFKVTTVQIRANGSFNVKVSHKLLGSIWLQGNNIANLKSSLDDRLTKAIATAAKKGGFKEPEKLASARRSVAKVFNGLTTGAVVFFDANRNLQLDTTEDDAYSEPWTFVSHQGVFIPAVPLEFDNNGNGFLDDADGQWVVLDGTYSATGLPAESLRMAPASWGAITPISTLVTLLSQSQSITPEEATTRVIQTLNLSNVDLSGFDVFAELASGNSLALSIYQTESALTNINRQFVALFQNSTSQTVPELSRNVYQLIVNSIWNATNSLNLADSAVVESWLHQLGALTNATLSETDLNTAAEVVASLNREMADRISNQIYPAVEAVEAVKAIAQGEVPQAFQQLSSGQLTAEQLRQLFTGPALKSKIDGHSVVATLLVPDELNFEATSASGANVDIPAVAHDLLGRSLPVTLSHASGTLLPVGTTNVLATITDLDGSQVQRSIAVHVVDTTAPTLNIPTILVEATSDIGADVTLPLNIAYDSVDAHPTVTFSMDSGVFPIGETVVEVIARDSSGNETTEQLTVRVWEPKPLAWRNELNQYDVSGDGVVTPLDALILINHLNQNGSHALGPEGPRLAEEWIDVSGDDRLTPLDALLVINQLNNAASAVGEASELAPLHAYLVDRVISDGWIMGERVGDADAVGRTPNGRAGL